MNRYSFLQLDVFTRRAFGGNQLAVFTDARGLTTDQMQALTREMNFSESTFVFPPETPGTDRRVRIFTPAMEMPMAGHPTVGTAAALVQRSLAQPKDGVLVLELGIGPVKVEIEARPDDETGAPFVWMNHRQPVFTPYLGTREMAAAALGLDPSDVRADLPLEIVSTGVPFLFVPLVSLAAAGRARSEAGALANLFQGQELANVALLTEEVVNREASVHARMFAPHLAGIVEDPATGSMAAPCGAYLARHGVLPRQPLVTFQIEQGIEMLRPSQITVEVGRAGDAFTSLRIGGHSVIVGQGEIFWN
jgi:trans-2,3-dihydro-3-hydroxyanthranilate isomerase